MEYKEAVKVTQARKVKEGFMLINLSYNTKLVLPYKDGMAFMASLTSAEQMSDEYNKPNRISEIARDAISIRVMSYDEYERHKIAALLNITPDEVKEFALKSD